MAGAADRAQGIFSQGKLIFSWDLLQCSDPIWKDGGTNQLRAPHVMSRNQKSPLTFRLSQFAALATCCVCLSSSPAFASDQSDPTPEGEQQDTIVLKLSLTDPQTGSVTELRQALKTGESFSVPLGGGASFVIETGKAKKAGKIHLGLAYKAADPSQNRSTERDCELPGEVKWSPLEDGPILQLQVRPHRKIKLILDGDPLA